MTYEIWDVPAGNLLASYDNEQDAWADIERRAQAHGDLELETLALAFEDDEGETHTIAAGRKLAHGRHAHA